MAAELAALIRRGRDLDAEIKAKTEELKKIKAACVAAGAGEHIGTDGAKALVIFPSPSIKPDEEAIGFVKKVVSPKIFGKLFVEVTTWTPVKAFREVLAAVVESADKREEIIDACEKESAAQVRFS